jgi:hypothetical protein
MSEQLTIEVLAEQVKGLRDLIAANDLRYQTQFAGAKEAIVTALASAEKAVSAAMAAAEKAVAAALAAAEKATEKSETSIVEHFKSVNEFRGTLKDQQDLFMLKSEAEAKLEGFNRALLVLERALADMRVSDQNLMTKPDYETRHNELIKQIADLKESRSANVGEKEGGKESRALLFAIVGVVIGVIGMVVGVVAMILK